MLSKNSQTQHTLRYYSYETLEKTKLTYGKRSILMFAWGWEWRGHSLGRNTRALWRHWNVLPLDFSSSHVWIWELDCKESWASKNWCFWTMVLEKTLKSPLDCKEMQPVHPKGNKSWIFIGRTDAEAETPILWPLDAKKWLIGKDCDAGKEWRQEDKGTTKDEMVGWHHWLNGHECKQAPGTGDEQGSLSCCSQWGRRVRHDWVTEMTDWLTDIFIIVVVTQLYKFIQNAQLKQVHLLYVNFTSIKLCWIKIFFQLIPALGKKSLNKPNLQLYANIFSTIITYPCLNMSHVWSLQLHRLPHPLHDSSVRKTSHAESKHISL